MSNSVFDKTMGKIRKHRDTTTLITNDKRRNYYSINRKSSNNYIVFKEVACAHNENKRK